MRAGPVRLASSSNQRCRGPIGRALMWTSTVAKLLAARRSGVCCCCAVAALANTASAAVTRVCRIITTPRNEGRSILTNARAPRYMYDSHIWDSYSDQTRDEKRQRGAPDPGAHRTRAEARL